MTAYVFQANVNQLTTKGVVQGCSTSFHVLVCKAKVNRLTSERAAEVSIILHVRQT